MDSSTSDYLTQKLQKAEADNKLLRTALADIRDHEEDESWTYEIARFIAHQTLKIVDS